MARRDAYVLDVVCAYAFLRRRRARRGGALCAEEDRLEGDHACDGEEDRRVVRDETGGGPAVVTAGGVEGEEGVADFDGSHVAADGDRLGWGRGGGDCRRVCRRAGAEETREANGATRG